MWSRHAVLGLHGSSCMWRTVREDVLPATPRQRHSAFAKLALNPALPPSHPQGHGTHTAGTVGAVGSNSLGVTGMNWKVGGQLLAGASMQPSAACGCAAKQLQVPQKAPYRSWLPVTQPQVSLHICKAASSSG